MLRLEVTLCQKTQQSSGLAIALPTNIATLRALKSSFWSVGWGIAARGTPLILFQTYPGATKQGQYLKREWTVLVSHPTLLPRSCIGRRFAQLELYMMMAKIVQRFKMEQEGAPLGVITNFISIPDKNVNIKFTERRSRFCLIIWTILPSILIICLRSIMSVTSFNLILHTVRLITQTNTH